MSTGTGLMREIHRAVGALPWVRLFRNNVGFGLVVRHRDSRVRQKIIDACIALAERLGGSAERIAFGLHAGSGDQIGWTTITITPEMVGRKVAVFTSIEVKHGTGRPTDEQLNWAEQINRAGGIAGIARSIDDAMELVWRDRDPPG